MLECLLAFFARWLWVVLVPEEEGEDSPTPPTPPPPPPAAKAGVNEGAATSATENVASAANLMIIQLAMQTSCIPARWSPTTQPKLFTPVCFKHSRKVFQRIEIWLSQ